MTTLNLHQQNETPISLSAKMLQQLPFYLVHFFSKFKSSYIGLQKITALFIIQEPSHFFSKTACTILSFKNEMWTLTCQADPEFAHRQHTTVHPPWRSGSLVHPPTSLYSTHSSARLRMKGVAEGWIEKIKGRICIICECVE